MNTFIEVEMDDDLRKQFDEILEKIGLDENTAFNIFAKAVVRYKRIPFELASFRSPKVAGALKRPLKATRQAITDGAVNLKERIKTNLQKMGLDLSQLDLSQLDFSKVDLNTVFMLTSQILDFLDGAQNGGANNNNRGNNGRGNSRYY